MRRFAFALVLTCAAFARFGAGCNSSDQGGGSGGHTGGGSGSGGTHADAAGSGGGGAAGIGAAAGAGGVTEAGSDAQGGAAGTTADSATDDASAGIAGFDPLAPENLTKAFSLATTHAGTSFVRFWELQGTPKGPGATYQTIPFRWVYRFSSCDTATLPCPNPKYFSVVQPGWWVEPIDQMPFGLSLSEAEFPAAVPLTFLQLLAKTNMGPVSCPMLPTPNGAAFILLKGGTKSGSGNPLWYWEFACSSSVPPIPNPTYFDAKGDPIT